MESFLHTGVYADTDTDSCVKALKAKAEELSVEYVQAHAPMGQPITKNNKNPKQFYRCLGF